MYQIEIADSDFQRLQSLAEPFVDTPAIVISKLLDAYLMKQPAADSRPSTQSIESSLRYSANSPPPLTHSKVMEAAFGSSNPKKPTWDSLVRLALEKTFSASGKSIQSLRRVSGANLVEGRKANEGYKFHQEIDCSFQGVSAEDAMKIVARCARELGERLYVEFVWRDKPDAHKPGKRAVIFLD